MKVYVVTHGCYSDEHIVAIRSKREDAEWFASLEPDGRVEEWDVDQAQVDSSLKPWTVTIDQAGNISQAVQRLAWNHRYRDGEILQTVFIDWDDEVLCFARDEAHAIKIATDTLKEWRAKKAMVQP